MRFINTLLLFLVAFSLHSQIRECSYQGKSPWLLAYQSRSIAPLEGAFSQELPTKIQFHIIRQSADFAPATDYTQEYILERFCQLRAFASPHQIELIMNGPILETILPNLDDFDILQLAIFLEDYKVPNALNIFCVDGLLSAPGVYFPNRDLILSDNLFLTNTEQRTYWLAHEIGHAFQLPHTWDGRVLEFGPIGVDSPAPDSVSGVAVEKAGDSNCLTAGDGFCDTAPDYHSGLIACGSDGNVGTIFIDPDSTVFAFPSTYLMSFLSGNDCLPVQNMLYTEEQSQVMRQYLLESDFVDTNYQLPPEVVDGPVLIAPLFGDILEPNPDNSVQLEWTAVNNATTYLVQLSNTQFFSYPTREFALDTTTLLLDLNEVPDAGSRIYWRVVAYNEVIGCELQSSIISNFTQGLFSNVASFWLEASVKCFPNPMGKQSTPP